MHSPLLNPRTSARSTGPLSMAHAPVGPSRAPGTRRCGGHRRETRSTASVLLRYLEPWSVYLRVPAEYGSLPELRETESGQPQTPPHPRKRTTADAGAAAAAAARSPDRKRLPCIQVYSVMTPLADSSMRCLRLPRPVRVFFSRWPVFGQPSLPFWPSWLSRIS